MGRELWQNHLENSQFYEMEKLDIIFFTTHDDKHLVTCLTAFRPRAKLVLAPSEPMRAGSLRSRSLSSDYRSPPRQTPEPLGYRLPYACEFCRLVSLGDSENV